MFVPFFLFLNIVLVESGSTLLWGFEIRLYQKKKINTTRSVISLSLKYNFIVLSIWMWWFYYKHMNIGLSSLSSSHIRIIPTTSKIYYNSHTGAHIIYQLYPVVHHCAPQWQYIKQLKNSLDYIASSTIYNK